VRHREADRRQNDHATAVGAAGKPVPEPGLDRGDDDGEYDRCHDDADEPTDESGLRLNISTECSCV
jgi:hypothetical protein